MARTSSITYEQVAEAAAKLAANGETPSVRRLREALGTGSNATIQTHLHHWQDQQRALPQPAIAASESFTRALASELARVRTEALAETAEALEQANTARLAAEAEAARVADDNEALRARIRELEERTMQDAGRIQVLEQQRSELRDIDKARQAAEKQLAAAEATVKILEPRAAQVDALTAKVATLEAQQKPPISNSK